MAWYVRASIDIVVGLPIYKLDPYAGAGSILW